MVVTRGNVNVKKDGRYESGILHRNRQCNFALNMDTTVDTTQSTNGTKALYLA